MGVQRAPGQGLVVDGGGAAGAALDGEHAQQRLVV